MKTTRVDDPPLVGRELPLFVRDLLASAPKVGSGVNNWLFRIARLLHPYRREEEIIELLRATLHGEQIRAGAIERATYNSKAAAWQPGIAVTRRTGAASAWPAVDTEAVQRIVGEGPEAVDLCDLSPVNYDMDDGSNAEEIVEMLFSTSATPDPLLCIGNSSRDFATRPLSHLFHTGKLPYAALIVPSPMTACMGCTKEGKESEHTLANTGPRRFLVVEFDRGSTDSHAALLWHLAKYGPLSLVVHSGGKSLHGWFHCEGQPESSLRHFMRYAVSRGADRATWTRSQFVRLPGGLRENGRRQQVFYFDPSTVHDRDGL